MLSSIEPSTAAERCAAENLWTVAARQSASGAAASFGLSKETGFSDHGARYYLPWLGRL